MKLYVIITILIAMLIVTSCGADIAGEVSTALSDKLSYEKSDFQLTHKDELEDYCKLANGETLYDSKSITNSRIYCISKNKRGVFQGTYPARINEIDCGNDLKITSVKYLDDSEQHGERFDFYLADGYYYNPNTQKCETCGNLILSTNLEEECDDGNLIDGDGCSSKCQEEDYSKYPYKSQKRLDEVYANYCLDLEGNWISGKRDLNDEDAETVWCGNDGVFRIKEINCETNPQKIGTHKIVFYHKDSKDYDIRDDIWINTNVYFDPETKSCKSCGEGTVTTISGEQCDPPNGKTCNL